MLAAILIVLKLRKDILKEIRLYLYGSGDNGHYFCTNFT